MAEQRFIFEDLSRLNAGAQGVPGKRTFYLIAGQHSTWVRMWLEKEQLQALALALDQLLDSVADQGQPEGADLSLLSEADPPEPPDDEFRIGRLALGHDPARSRIVLAVHRAEGATERLPALQLWASRPQMRALSQRIKEVCAAGRPSCPLCGGPIGPEGHPCPKANGHRALEMEVR